MHAGIALVPSWELCEYFNLSVQSVKDIFNEPLPDLFRSASECYDIIMRSY